MSPFGLGRDELESRAREEELAGHSSSSGEGSTRNVSSDDELGDPDVVNRFGRQGSILSMFEMRRLQSATISMNHYRTYEIWSLGAVVVSVTFAIVESMPRFQHFQQRHPEVDVVLICAHGVLGTYFVFDYIWRIWCDGWNYACSFFGAVDFFGAAAIVPDVLDFVRTPWKSTFEGNIGSLLRAVRLLRVFRVMKLSRFQDELNRIKHALTAETHAIVVFFLTIWIALLFLGSMLYVVEGGKSINSHTKGFDSIPQSLWWAIVTLTTVGYGDVVPQTVIGRLIACFIMLLGYSMLAVPTITSVLGTNDPLTNPEKKLGFPRLVSPGPPFEQAQLQGCRAFGPLQAEDEAELLEPPEAGVLGSRGALRQYPFVVNLPTRQGDADEYGFIQSSTFSLFIEAAVASLLAGAAAPPRELEGPSETGLTARPKPFAVKTTCSVLLPVALPESLDAGVAVEELGPSTCTFAVGLFAHSSGRLCALGRLHHSWVDATSRQPTSMPNEVHLACGRYIHLSL